MNRFFLILFLFTFSCTSKQMQNSQQNLSFDEVEIPLHGSAVIGDLVEFSNTTDLIFYIKINSIRQGGAAGPIFQNGSTEQFILSKSFLRKYLEENGKELLESTSVGDQLLIIVSKDLKSNAFVITNLIRS